jgi:hypothetical protein
MHGERRAPSRQRSSLGSTGGRTPREVSRAHVRADTDQRLAYLPQHGCVLLAAYGDRWVCQIGQALALPLQRDLNLCMMG